MNWVRRIWRKSFCFMARGYFLLSQAKNFFSSHRNFVTVLLLFIYLYLSTKVFFSQVGHVTQVHFKPEWLIQQLHYKLERQKEKSLNLSMTTDTICIRATGEISFFISFFHFRHYVFFSFSFSCYCHNC